MSTSGVPGVLDRVKNAVLDVPVTTLFLIGTMVIIFVVGLILNSSASSVCLSSYSVIHNAEVGRIFSSPFFHVNFFHIGLNMLSLGSIAPPMERLYGSIYFLWLNVILALASSLLLFALSALLALAWSPAAFTCSVGYSGVLFALTTIQTAVMPSSETLLVFGLCPVPARLYPWALLLIVQMISPGVSFMGHLTGILTGLLFVSHVLQYVMPSAALVNRIESVPLLAPLVQRPSFVVAQGLVGDLIDRPSISGWQRVKDWLRALWLRVRGHGSPSAGSVLSGAPVISGAAPVTDGRFPGQGRVLGGTHSTATEATAADVDDLADSDQIALLPVKAEHESR